MSEGQRSTLLAYLRRLCGGAMTDDSDAVLLERFIEQRDETAFEALLRRHGPLVWSVCRRVLIDEHAAEDAFQATFLVLVRKAQSVSKKTSIRSWLYGVALRVALRARQREGLRHRREQETPSRPNRDPAAEADWQDVRPILDEEIQRLPEKYRLPIVLCYLEGRTNDEAARLLNCPRGTLATRLTRARERLRSRLIRRGLTLSVGTLTVVLSDNALSAAMPVLLVAQTVKIVLAGTASVSITVLAEGVLHAMSTIKFLKLHSLVGIVILAGGLGAGAFYFVEEPAPVQKNEEPPPPAAKAPKQEPPPPAAKAPKQETDALTTLMKERLKLAEEEVKIRQKRLEAGAGTVVELADPVRRLFKAELELSPNKDARIAAHQKHVKTAEKIARYADRGVQQGMIRKEDGLLLQYLLIDAKIDLEREKAQK